MVSPNTEWDRLRHIDVASIIISGSQWSKQYVVE